MQLCLENKRERTSVCIGETHVSGKFGICAQATVFDNGKNTLQTIEYHFSESDFEELRDMINDLDIASGKRKTDVDYWRRRCVLAEELLRHGHEMTDKHFDKIMKDADELGPEPTT